MTEIERSEIEHTEFTRKYVDLLVNVWRDEEELRKLLADPTTYAAEAGLPVAAGDVVVLDRTPLENLPTKSEVTSKWDLEGSRHVLVVPENPLVDLSELSDADLELAGADNVNNVHSNVKLCLLSTA